MKFLKILFFVLIGYCLIAVDKSGIIFGAYVIFWIIRGSKIVKRNRKIKIQKEREKEYKNEERLIAEQNQIINYYIHQQQETKKSEVNKVGKLIPCRCKNCNAPLIKKTDFYICEYCDSKFTIERTKN